MRATRIVTACLIGLLVSASHAAAGMIFLSGDSNIGNGIDGSFGVVTPGNTTFFTNVLGSGKKVLIHDEFSGLAPSLPDSANAINNLYNGMAGVSSTRDTSGSAITSAALADVDLFISILPTILTQLAKFQRCRPS